jgi:hypothetical protein
MDATRRFFAAVFRWADSISKVRAEGGLDADLERELARGLGLEQIQHERAVVQDAATIADEMRRVEEEHLTYLENLEDGGAAFSLLPESRGGDNVFTDEQKSRFQESIPAIQAVFDKLGDFGGASSEQLAKILGDYRQIAVGEALLVDQGLKPLFHEAGVFLPDKAQEFVSHCKCGIPPP